MSRRLHRVSARSAEDERWVWVVGGLELTIERRAPGRWAALYGGFSRAEGAELTDAIAVAIGSTRDNPVIAELARRIDNEPSPS
jgi:hypothetical protein